MIGVVTGLVAEAKLIEKACARKGYPAPALAPAGADGARARDAANGLIAAGATTLVSFGLCGGLDPTLRPGDLLIAEEVILTDGRRLSSDASLRADLQARIADVGVHSVGGALLGSNHAIAKAEEKAAHFNATHARAVDMESHGVALAAEAAGVPFAIARAVADPAGRDLPRAALKATGPDGRLRILATIASMYLRPWEGPAMIRLAHDARLAFDSLEKIADLFGGD